MKEKEKETYESEPFKEFDLGGEWKERKGKAQG
jgi:hypothetical protein